MLQEKKKTLFSVYSDLLLGILLIYFFDKVLVQLTCKFWLSAPHLDRRLQGELESQVLP